ncbi:hypothetical protein GBAR_LOCUS28358, partial [Geodia barretti]
IDISLRTSLEKTSECTGATIAYHFSLVVLNTLVECCGQKSHLLGSSFFFQKGIVLCVLLKCTRLGFTPS